MGERRRFYVNVSGSNPEVTGSCTLCTVNYPDGTSEKIIIDCGSFQEKDYEEYNNSFQFDPQSIKACLLTHCHTDHVGQLPLLSKEGYSKKVYATKDTNLILNYSLMDNYKIMKEKRKHKKEKPLYSEEHVENALSLRKTVLYNKSFQVTPNIKATYFNNGHVIGGAIIALQISYQKEEDIVLVFTGDFHCSNIFYDIEQLPDWLLKSNVTIVQESTYGDIDSKSIKKCYNENISKAISKKKTIIVPVLALKAAEMLYRTKIMQDKGLLDTSIPIYLDGTLAKNYVELYNKQFDIKEEMKDFFPENFNFVDKTIRAGILNSSEPKIIFTTSGMGSFGTAPLYISKFIQDENALIHFVNYLAKGSLGDILKSVNLDEEVEINGKEMVKKAEVKFTSEFSSHAKADEMVEFLKKFEKIQAIISCHGETKVKQKFSKRIQKEIKVKASLILGRNNIIKISHYGFLKEYPKAYSL